MGFGNIFDALSIVEEYFPLPKQSVSEGSEYVDVVEEMGESQEDKEKSSMFSTSHAIQEQQSSSREKSSNILRALLPFPVDVSPDPIPNTTHRMKILIGLEEVDARDVLVM